MSTANLLKHNDNNLTHGRIESIHILRACTILFIIYRHALWAFDGDQIESGIYFFSVVDLLSFNFTVFFVLISGFLFQHLAYKYHVKKYYLAKIKNVLLPYLVVSLVCVLLYYRTELADLPFFSFHMENQIITVFLMFCNGTQLLPLWFIPMMMIIFIISPLLFTLSKQNLIVISIVLMFWVMIYPKPDFTQPFFNIMHYLPVYIIGMMIRQNYALIMSVCQKHRLSLMLFVLLCLMIPFVHRHFEVEIYTSNAFLDTIQKIVLFILVLYFLTPANQHKWTGRGYQFIAYLANVSFSLFFIHQIVIIEVEKFIRATGWGAHMMETKDGYLLVLYSLLFTVVIVLLCLLIIFIIKKLTRRYSKFLIGG